jgi:hypothetical protein
MFIAHVSRGSFAFAGPACRFAADDGKKFFPHAA